MKSQVTDMMNYEMHDLYVHMVNERHKIWLSRQDNAPQPWTNDSVLANLKMTNMFRVLDPGSQFVFLLDNDEPWDTIARLVFYRLTNRPATWYAMKGEFGSYPGYDDFIHRSAPLFAFLNTYRNEGNRVFSGAYIIIPEPGTANDKVGGALRVVRHFLQHNAQTFLDAEEMDEKFDALQATPGLGKFLSMQIITDWTYLQSEEPNLSFVKAGPGAARGAELIHPGRKPEDVIYDLAINDWMGHSFVNIGNRTLTPMDVQNTFCEFSKYARERVNPRKKNVYRPAHPGPQSRPILPLWW